jgi:hypothetical protein
MPVVRELESLQHIVPYKNDANENADSLNSNNLDDGGGQELIQRILVGMQLSTSCDEEWIIIYDRDKQNAEL